MRILRVPAVLSAVTAVALVLAGCGSSEGETATPAAEQDTPLTKYFEAVYGGDLSPAEQEQQFAEETRQQEELVAECMQEQGFEYTPDTTNGGYVSGDDVEWEPDDRDWVAQYGYGAAKSPYSEAPQPEQEYVDPNGDYLATLSDSEQTAFQEALYGAPPPEEELEGDGSYTYEWESAGCQGAAQHEVAGEDLSQSEEFKTLFEAMNGLYEDMASWPGMAELESEWATCMDAAGHGGFATQVDAQNSVYEDLDTLYESNVPSGAEGTDDGADDSAAAGEEFSGGPDEAALDSLAEKEVVLALADLDCREETDYRTRYADAQREVEEQFISDHETELDALLAAAEQD